MTMATSTELRVPLLDARVLEFAASLPSDFKVRNWSTKRVLKEALRDSVPEEILRRKKAGFPVPYASWLAGPMKSFVHDTLLGDSAISNYFNKDSLRRLIDGPSGQGAAGKEVFSLVVLELWHRQFAQAA
jgi:asparagine synthase (glutamine-hydrolysing)